MAELDNLLSQEELDALTAGLQDGSIEADTGLNSDVSVMRHDLTNEDSSLGVNVGAIDMINERFIRQFRLGLLEVLRTTPKDFYFEEIRVFQAGTRLEYISME